MDMRNLIKKFLRENSQKRVNPKVWEFFFKKVFSMEILVYKLPSTLNAAEREELVMRPGFIVVVQPSNQSPSIHIMFDGDPEYVYVLTGDEEEKLEETIRKYLGINITTVFHPRDVNQFIGRIREKGWDYYVITNTGETKGELNL